MFGTKKRRILHWSAIINSIFILSACTSVNRPKEILQGYTQGTTYQVTLINTADPVTNRDLNALFARFDQVLSTYIDTSVISRINAAQDSISIIDTTGYFKRCYDRALEIYTLTGGAFDPSVYPLVEGWGFMNDLETPLEKDQVDSLMQYISFEQNRHHRIWFNGDTIIVKKFTAHFKLDFNAIAQGLAVDVVSDFLKSKGYQDYYIEIGGEVYVSGKNAENSDWRIGIDSPANENLDRNIDNIVSVSNKAVATSGNYRKFYEKDGIRYAHTLNPKTGFPVQHSLLSATVIADNCMDADAYATAFMVFGVDKTLQFLENNNLDLGVYLIYSNDKGEMEYASNQLFRDLEAE